jgi:hypothetical protein
MHFGLLFLACWTSTCALSLEDKIQILTEKFVRYTVICFFPTSPIPNSYFTFLLKEIVEAKVNHLENENNKLKAKIEQQDSILTDLLQNQRQTNEETKRFPKNVFLENPTSGKSAAMPRTCREAHLSNPALASGMYWIDPDGQGVGDDPISVYCDMASGMIFYNPSLSQPKYM